MPSRLCQLSRLSSSLALDFVWLTDRRRPRSPVAGCHSSRHRQARLLAPHRCHQGARRHPALAPGRARPKAAADADVVIQLLWSVEGQDLAAIREFAAIAFRMALEARRSELVTPRRRRSHLGAERSVRSHPPLQDRSGGPERHPSPHLGTPTNPPHPPASLARAARVINGQCSSGFGKAGTSTLPAIGPCRRPHRASAHASAAGLDAASYARHSLRADFVTAAANDGADIWRIQQVSRYKSMQVLAGYVRDGRVFDNHAGGDFL